MCWCLFADSTNIDRRGYTGSELDVQEAFEEMFTSTQGKMVVAAFASSIYRMQILADLAVQFDRKVAFVGRGMNENSQIAQRLGYLKVPTGVLIRDSDVPSFPSQDVLCLVTGSQGEANAALSRIAIDDHRFVKLAAARPGRDLRARDSRQRESDRARHEPHRSPRRRRYHGVVPSTCTSPDTGPKRSSSWSSRSTKPRYFMPIHGEFRQLARHARVADS